VHGAQHFANLDFKNNKLDLKVPISQNCLNIINIIDQILLENMPKFSNQIKFSAIWHSDELRSHLVQLLLGILLVFFLYHISL